MKKQLFALVFVCLLGLGQVAQGAVMGFDFIGTITGISGMEDNTNAFPSLAVGNTFHGGFFYDPDAAAVYDFSGGTPPAKVFHAESYWIDFGDFTVVAGTDAGSLTSVDVLMTDSTQDTFKAVDWTPYCNNASVLFDELMLTLIDPTGSGLNGPELPLASQLASFTQGFMNLIAYPLYGTSNFSTADIQGSIDGLTAHSVPVPEPAVFVLLGLGIVALVPVMRKRSQNRA